MKKIKLLFIGLFLFSLQIFSQEQIKFEYDASGNCIVKYKTIVMKSSLELDDIEEDFDLDIKNLQEDLGDYKIHIYPNPTQGLLRIEIAGLSEKKACRVFLLDMSGKLLVNKMTNDNFIELDLTSYQSGTYILRLDFEGKETTEWKIIKL